ARAARGSIAGAVALEYTVDRRPTRSPTMDLDWSPLAEFIDAHQRFLVTTHVRPDGDALGSEVGMAGLLEQRGKDVRVVNVSPTPPRYDFLAPRPRFFERFADVRAENLADRQAVII